jgi:hypothetical protein
MNAFRFLAGWSANLGEWSPRRIRPKIVGSERGLTRVAAITLDRRTNLLAGLTSGAPTASSNNRPRCGFKKSCAMLEL